ncbi:hypothetical protein FMUND_2241 [Fusarium mundagurra]|uniref:Uncharacterized protein n=1 Tax=Fusarium mundagurra TaxID=1567541 RepID=A0A8H5Z176_9HYPO|nr:hypothetical protein FMUND_2241 [Fusarium mundagurra]
MNKAKQAIDPVDTPDMVPIHPLTGKAAEEDYQKQLALLEQQIIEHQNETSPEKARESQSSNSSTQNTDCRT